MNKKSFIFFIFISNIQMDHKTQYSKRRKWNRNETSRSLLSAQNTSSVLVNMNSPGMLACLIGWTRLWHITLRFLLLPVRVYVYSFKTPKTLTVTIISMRCNVHSTFDFLPAKVLHMDGAGKELGWILKLMLFYIGIEYLFHIFLSFCYYFL